MMKHGLIRTWLSPLRNTPFHPQWLALKNEKERLKRIGSMANGLVLDIGAGKQKVAHYLSPYCSYVSLDYLKTATAWYNVRPQVFGDGQMLPFAEGIFDAVLLLDVLEHVPRPEHCIREIHRVLKPRGKVVINVPFLYPLHDTPLDFQRWTVYGLRELATRSKFKIVSEKTTGSSLQTAALLANLAYSNNVLRGWHQSIWLLLLGFWLPFIVFTTNVRAWLTERVASTHDTFMPHGYEVVWEKVS